MPIKVIHVGVGVRGRHWLEIVAAHPDFVSVACVDPDEKSLQAARSSPGQQHGQFVTIEEVAGRVEADAALVARPRFFIRLTLCRRSMPGSPYLWRSRLPRRSQTPSPSSSAPAP